MTEWLFGVFLVGAGVENSGIWIQVYSKKLEILAATFLIKFHNGRSDNNLCIYKLSKMRLFLVWL